MRGTKKLSAIDAVEKDERQKMKRRSSSDAPLSWSWMSGGKERKSERKNEEIKGGGGREEGEFISEEVSVSATGEETIESGVTRESWSSVEFGEVFEERGENDETESEDDSDVLKDGGDGEGDTEG